MFDNRTIYLYDYKGKLAVDFDKWYFVDDDLTMRERTYTNLTDATIDRLERIIKKGYINAPKLKNNRVWLPVWFQPKVYLSGE